MEGPIKHKALINVDMGEGYGNWSIGPDADLLPLVDHANIACGFHASDPLIMMETVQNCIKHGVKIGAHPGFPDLQGFGRREMKLTPDELTAMIVYQVGALKGFLDREGAPLHHVKPHGMLYGMCCKDYETAKAVFLGIPKGVPIFGLAGTCMELAARDLGIEFIAEFYADVKYNADSSLVIERKKRPWNTDEVYARVTQQLQTSTAPAVDGSTCTIPVKNHPVSICCHSDVPGCVEVVKATRAAVDAFNKSYFPGA
ncbi:lactam utilization protein lamb [Talaromyces proteolyticus]|uniref:Lactam utilization protein lamb n=1 Tax=Talaromyces proteolyticus TaxID=1131652 RepID=A0AAD4KE19_9EURO|nr:lactam utilization protein lamb [Talaromyces proteolyticus]KAH8689662.1 lactam utilization protein lamb [Talaromyces proteolyticus]